MAKTESTMLELGTPAPDFALPDTEGGTVRLADFDDKPALLVAFICNHCPFVKLIRESLAEFAHEYQPKGLAVVGINANDPQQAPADAPDKMRHEKLQAGYPFPYLFDETQAVAKAYRAACTPDFFLFDQDRRLVYRGRYDDATPGRDVPPTGHDLRAAVDAVLQGQSLAEQHPSMGCNIKWRPGNEPGYAA